MQQLLSHIMPKDNYFEKIKHYEVYYNNRYMVTLKNIKDVIDYISKETNSCPVIKEKYFSYILISNPIIN